jgi:uncharacterized protein (TIGR00369 family)
MSGENQIQSEQRQDLSVVAGGFQKLLNYRLVIWEKDHAEIQLDATEHHTNRSGLLHGGVHATLLDSVAGLTGVFCTVPGNVIRATTLSFSLQFIAAGKTGLLRAVGRRRGGGSRIFFAAAEILDEDGRLLATGEGCYRYIPGFEPPNGAPIDAPVLRQR